MRQAREEVDESVLAEAIGNINFDDDELPVMQDDECEFEEPECVYLKEIMRHLKASEVTS